MGCISWALEASGGWHQQNSLFFHAPTVCQAPQPKLSLIALLGQPVE